MAASHIHSMSLDDAQHKSLLLLIPLCCLPQQSLNKNKMNQHVEAPDMVATDFVPLHFFFYDLDLRPVVLRFLERGLAIYD